MREAKICQKSNQTQTNSVMSKYSDCCRICLKITDSSKSIFNLYFDSIVYSKIIGDFLDSEIYENEKLPIQICDVCECLLLSSYEFRKLSIESNEILKNFLETETDIKIEDTESHIKIEEYFSDNNKSIKEDENSDSDSTYDPSEPETSSKNDPDKKRRSPKSDVPKKRDYRRNKTAPIKCTLCNITLPNTPAYNLHRRIEHLKLTVCSTCGKTVQKCNLTQHLNTHLETTDCKCDLCGKGFKTKTHLNNHITATHQKLKRYKCEHCDLKFVHSTGRRSHIDRIHLNCKRFECKVCPAKFFESIELKMHTMRQHTGEKKFKCDICNDFFVSATILKYHKRIHMEEKMFNCEVCGKGFANKSGLTRHLKIHNKNFS